MFLKLTLKSLDAGHYFGVTALNVSGSRGYVRHKWLKPDGIEDRRYQREILETAQQKNTLVVLPTALGKTVIALWLAVERVEKGKVFFLAPTKPLVNQHRRMFLEKTLFDKKELVLATGRYPPPKRAFLYIMGRIIFATPQCLRNDLENGLVTLEDASLIVFDEAHRAKGKYAYVPVADYYFYQCSKPLVLGLTASPGGYEEQIREVCQNLRVEDIEYRTEDSQDVKPYLHPIRVRWTRVGLPEVYLQVRDKLKEMMLNQIEDLKSMGVLLGKPPSTISRRDLVDLNKRLKRRILEGKEGPVYQLKVKATVTLSLMHMVVLIETQGPRILQAFIERSLKPKASQGSKGHQSIIQDPLFRQALEKLDQSLALNNPKMRELKELLTREMSTGDSRIIIFTQYRDTVRCILKSLQTVSNVKMERFVGQSDREGDPGMSQRQQRVALQKLRSGEVNVLVATSIAEEGLDIPEVDHVVFYEPVPSEVRYIQRRGRTGRKVAGEVTILIAENTLDEAFYWASKKRTQKMRKMIKELNQKLPDMLSESSIPPSSRSPEEFKTRERSFSLIKDDKGLLEKRQERKLWKPKRLPPRGLTAAVKWLRANVPEQTTSISTLIKEAVEESGIGQPVMEAALWKLLQQGQLYQPEPGKINRL
ncbi:MAG: helicase-related protein [Thermoproteota archaeon]